MMEGWDCHEDTLPPRLLDASEDGPGSTGLTRNRLATMIEAYYAKRGWNQDGWVPESLRRELDLDGPAFG
jgi:aldehyde:ferredoxin oxidoreductase